MRNAEPISTPKTASIALRLLGLVRPLTLPMCGAVLIGSLGHLCTIFIPVLGGYILLGAMGLPQLMPFHLLIAAIAACAVCRSVFRYLEQRLNHYIAFRLLAVIRDRVFGALRRLSPARVEGRDKGDLISMITADIELIEVFYAHTISPVLIAVLVSASVCAFLASLHPLLALAAAVAYFSIAALIPRIGAKGTAAAGDSYRKALGEQSAFMLDSLRGVDQTIQYGDGAARLARLRQLSAGLSRTQGRIKAAESRSAALKTAAILLFSAMLFAAGFLLLRAGQLDYASVLLAAVAVPGSFAPVSAVADLSSGLVQTFASAARIFALLDETPAVEEVTNGKEVPCQGMACEKITFGYNKPASTSVMAGPDTPSQTAPGPTLRELDFRLPEGRIVGICGDSGSGKSTLLKLLMRFWDVDAGRVTMSGEDVKGVNTSCLRGLQSYMTQETQMFSGSLLDNIRLAKPSADMGEVVLACEKASILPFIESLPDGLDTQVGELGERLSSGERQRIGLARAFLSGAPLMLLDEPTSNLDSLNESAILRALCEGSGRSQTVLLLSHRKSTLRVAEEIYEMESGALSLKDKEK
ncbi:MAG: ABC transporter ATP-binding protein/permease [Clostridiales Family XIII bacterium]|jgi:ATP-binding cassette subfamily C protein|nr:ABC transporter ATP-binding protein/permease [Clostridiales Family XIII bacterium]